MQFVNKSKFKPYFYSMVQNNKVEYNCNFRRYALILGKFSKILLCNPKPKKVKIEKEIETQTLYKIGCPLFDHLENLKFWFVVW